MSVRITSKWVQRLIKDEYMMASQLHGRTFAGTHEGYAIIMEEVEEAAEDMASIDWHIGYMWQAVKEDNYDGVADAADIILKKAAHLACEAIQVAAMAIKMLLTLKRKEKNQ